MNLEKELIIEDKYTYKCFDELKRLLKENDNFREAIEKGVELNKIMGFPSELWDKISSQNIRGVDSFDTVFKDGANIGYCTVAARQLSYSLPYCYLCGGTLPILKGTRNCEDGRHTWISFDKKIIDTTLMLIIAEDYANNIGYIEENRYDPSVDAVYNATKDFTNDHNLRRG